MSDLSFEEIAKIQANPGRAVTLVLNKVSQALTGDLNAFGSLTHPFPVALDFIASNAYGLVNRIADAEAGIYYQYAQTAPDLYRHMADAELWGLFGMPSSSTIRYAIPNEEIERLAVPYNETSGTVINQYRKLVIPKDTIINVYGINFTTLNPIEIRLTEMGFLQVVYDADNQNPFFPVTDNVLTRSQGVVNGHRYLFIDVPVKQLEVTMKRNLPISPSSGLKGSVSFTEQLYGVRAWLTNTLTNTRQEIQVLYTNQVFDADVMSIVIIPDQDNGVFTYEIPDTYINSGKATGMVTLQIYTTKGAYEQDLSEIAYQKHTATYKDETFDNDQLDIYSAPIREVNNSEWKIVDSVRGGSNARTFAELKQARRDNARLHSLPVSDNQLTFDFGQYGYSLVKATSYSTGRLFQLTRDLPANLNTEGQNISLYTGTLGYSLEELKNTGVVYDNNESVTIPAGSLFRITANGDYLVPKAELDRISRLSSEDLVEYTNNNFTVFNPYHYVVDSSNEQVTVRSYLLDTPAFDYQKYLYERASLGIELGIASIGIEHTDEGYTIRLITRSDNNYKALADTSLGVQLFFQPADASTNASIKGTLLGKSSEGERIWEFKLKSNFKLDANDYLSLNGFTMFGEVQPNLLVKLSDYFGILFLMEGSNAGAVSVSDGKIETVLWDNPMFVMSEFGYQVKLGRSLTELYTRVRPIKGSAEYQRYEYDVPEVALVDDYKRDEEGRLVFDENNRLIISVRAGDVLYNPDGTMQIKYAKGTFIRDNTGALVPVKSANLKVHMDFFGLDGVYYFSNDAYDTALVKKTKDYISNVIMGDMAYLATRTLDKSVVTYQPRKTLGYVDVVMNAQTETSIQADLTFQVQFYLTAAGVQSDTLKTSLESTVVEIINDNLNSSLTFAKSKLIKQIRDAIPSEVVDFKLSVYSGESSIDVVTNKSGTTGFGIKCLLTLSGDEVRSVKNAITVNFIKHMPDQVI